MLHHPLTVVRAALADGARVDNLRRQLNGWQAVDIIAPAGETVTLSTDPATNLPVTVTSAAYHPNLGDVVIETTFSEYQDVNGLKLPAHVVTKLDRFVRDDLRFSTQTLDARADEAIAPDAVRPPQSRRSCRRQTVTVDEIGKGIWRLAGGSITAAVRVCGPPHAVQVSAK